MEKYLNLGSTSFALIFFFKLGNFLRAVICLLGKNQLA